MRTTSQDHHDAEQTPAPADAGPEQARPQETADAAPDGAAEQEKILGGMGTANPMSVAVHPSGVGVLDKAAHILDCLEAGPASLSQLVEATGLARPTAHRLAVALAHHRLVARDVQGRFVLGPRLGELSSAAGEDRLIAAAGPILNQLRNVTGESAQVYRRQGEWRICVASAERPIGLRDTIPVGTQLSMKAGSAAQVLIAWEDHNRLLEGLRQARFSATVLAAVRRRGWAQSVGERERGIASVSAPVRNPSGKVIAAVSISGPIERLTRQPGRLHADVVSQAARQLTEALRAGV